MFCYASLRLQSRLYQGQEKWGSVVTVTVDSDVTAHGASHPQSTDQARSRSGSLGTGPVSESESYSELSSSLRELAPSRSPTARRPGPGSLKSNSDGAFQLTIEHTGMIPARQPRIRRIGHSSYTISCLRCFGDALYHWQAAACGLSGRRCKFNVQLATEPPSDPDRARP